MTAAAPVSTSSDNSATDAMTAAFNQAISESAKITAITTEKKVELDASQQRPQS
ncbi:MAG TPA: hypothetical protein VGX23_24125 [Actinocrinis sp.]|nr:hypothetical protein [Actinocrinis sp.]